MFALLFVLGSFLTAFLLARVFKIRIREVEVFPEDTVQRSWRPPNPFKFPWTHWQDIKQLAKGKGKQPPGKGFEPLLERVEE